MDNKIVFFTGAGLSAESGIPTFRDSGGLWEEFDLDDVCNLRTWVDNYELVHQFYNDRRKQLADVEPNHAHKTIAELQKKYGPDRVKVITTNVDDLLTRAGCTEVLHIHGELTKIMDNGSNISRDIGYEPFDYKGTIAGEYKPDVIFFNEYAPRYGDMHDIIASLKGGDKWITIGSSEEVVNSGYTVKCINDSAMMVNVNPTANNEDNGAFDFNLQMTACEFFRDESAMKKLTDTFID